MSRFRRPNVIVAVALLAGLAVGAALAQPASPAPGGAEQAATVPATRPGQAPAVGAPAGAGMLTRIPEQAVAFVTVKNVADLGAKVDQLIADIGAGAMAPANVLEVLKRQADLGEGFNDNGGFSVVLLDPALLGHRPEDLAAEPMMLEEKGSPVVFLVPAADPRTLFRQHTATEEAGLVKLESPEGDVAYARALDGYSAIAEDPNALRVLLSATRPVMAKMARGHLAVLNEGDVVAYVDFKALRPWVKAYAGRIRREMEQQRQMMQAFGGAPTLVLVAQEIQGRMLGLYEQMFTETDALTVGARLTQPAIQFSEFTSYDPNSNTARLIRGVKVGKGVSLAHTPRLPYVAACFSAPMTEVTPDAQAAVRQMVSTWMPALTGPGAVSPRTSERLAQLAGEIYAQVRGGSMFIGAAPQGGGVFGLAMVLKVDNADAVMEKMPELIRLRQEVVNAAIASFQSALTGPAETAPAAETAPVAETAPTTTAPAGAPPQKVTLTYNPSGAAVADTTVATITVDWPELAAMEPNDTARLTAALGEERIRFYIAKADEQTLVATFGGTQAFLAEALEAARDGQDLRSDPDVAAALQAVEGDAHVITLFNLANLMAMIETGVREIGGPAAAERYPLAGVEFQARAPVVVAQSFQENAVSSRTYLPKEILGDLVRVYGAIMEAVMGPRMDMAQPMPDDMSETMPGEPGEIIVVPEPPTPEQPAPEQPAPRAPGF